MPFTEEIKQAAESLGKNLGADPDVQEYVRLLETAQQNSQAAHLEERLAHLYQKLAEREQNGQALDRAELDEYYELKQSVRMHPMIEARDNQLESVKGLFSQTAQRMTAILGINYPTFAKKEEV